MDADQDKQSEFVPLTGMLTHVLKYGQIKPRAPNQTGLLFLVIPGKTSSYSSRPGVEVNLTFSTY